MKVLWLHIENDHQYKFQCSYSNNNYNFKNTLWKRTKEKFITGEHLYVLSVMKNVEFTKSLNSKYRNCVKCKSSAPKQKVHKHNDEMHKEDEH